MGGLAGDALTDADTNTVVGTYALTADTKGSTSVAIGHSSLGTQNFTTSTTSYNTAVGFYSGLALTTGVQNTLIGYGAGDSLIDADHNVALGTNALAGDTYGSKSVAIGREALVTQNFTTATDSHNTAIGYAAGQAVTTGTKNTFVGSEAGDAIQTGHYNTALGSGALGVETVGDLSVALGYHALEDQVSDSAGQDVLNTAVGADAGGNLTTGIRNTFIGGQTASGAIITGDENTAVGFQALYALTSGTNNVALGQTGGQINSGSNNTCINGGGSVNTGSNNAFLGRDSGLSGSPGGAIATGSNEIVLGDENISEAHIQVDWTVASDERDKTDFTDLDIGLDFVKALEPITYKWDKRSKYGDKYDDDYDLNDQTPDGTHKEDWLDIGFKAQSVLALEEAAGYSSDDKTNLTVSLSGDGKQYGLQYSKFVPILVKAVQELSATVETLQAEIELLKGE